MTQQRGEWGSRVGFVLAAAGSAVGLGNIWKFPYITGENGGGAFVVVYLVCIAMVGLPILLGEILLGRMSRRSTVGAFRVLARERSAWQGLGWAGVIGGFAVLSFYSVVAGWAMKYTVLAIQGDIAHGDPAVLAGRFGQVAGDAQGATLWHLAFMAATVAIVLGGVRKGVELASRVMMPALMLMLFALMLFATRLPGFDQGFDFVFGFHTDKLTGQGVLAALGHSFFTLSVGLGAMLTYGSYLREDADIVGASLAITVLDTTVSLMACLVLFPITFSYGMAPATGPGLVFENVPVAFAQLPGSTIWAIVFFLLLVLAALTSSISMLEVVVAYFIDELGWSRTFAVAITGIAIAVLGVPSALSFSDGMFGAGMREAVGRSWFDILDYATSNWMLPLGGLGISVFAAWRLDDARRRVQFERGSRIGKLAGAYVAWLAVLRWLVPIAIVLIMLSGLGLIGAE